MHRQAILIRRIEKADEDAEYYQETLIHTLGRIGGVCDSEALCEILHGLFFLVLGDDSGDDGSPYRTLVSHSHVGNRLC